MKYVIIVLFLFNSTCFFAAEVIQDPEYMISIRGFLALSSKAEITLSKCEKDINDARCKYDLSRHSYPIPLEQIAFGGAVRAAIGKDKVLYCWHRESEKTPVSYPFNRGDILQSVSVGEDGKTVGVLVRDRSYQNHSPTEFNCLHVFDVVLAETNKTINGLKKLWNIKVVDHPFCGPKITIYLTNTHAIVNSTDKSESIDLRCAGIEKLEKEQKDFLESNYREYLQSLCQITLIIRKNTLQGNIYYSLPKPIQEWLHRIALITFL